MRKKKVRHFDLKELEKKDRWDTEELAFLRNKHPVTIAKERVSGTGPVFVKDGRNVYYLRADVERWEQTNKRRSTAG
jgi:hypothetical protein